MTHELSRIEARLFNAPLLVTPDVAEAIATLIVERSGPLAASGASSVGDDEAPYDVLDGVATIPVRGELVNRGSWLNSLSGLTSYDRLTDALKTAADDWRVQSILLDMDSPGGEAAGAMETADVVRSVATRKKTVAFVNGLGASAAYAIAAAASEIVVTPSANVGSIGVVWLHLDRSGAMAKQGVKPTLIHAGKYKVDGHGMGPLEPDVVARIQGSIDDVYALFTSSVGKHRPDLGEAGARKTEAALYMGAKAVDAGLADRVGDIDAARARLSRNPYFSKGPFMSAPDQPIFTQAAHDAAVANAVSAARRDAEAATTAAVADARAGERSRIAAILDGDNARGRAHLARHFALHTDMSPEAANAALLAAIAEVPASRLANVPNPALRPGPSAPVEPPHAAAADWSAIVAKLNKDAGVPAR